VNLRVVCMCVYIIYIYICCVREMMWEERKRERESEENKFTTEEKFSSIYNLEIVLLTTVI
jgi:NADH:ubiquinone oxidoreductase subunit 2 (subunit N)